MYITVVMLFTGIYVILYFSVFACILCSIYYTVKFWGICYLTATDCRRWRGQVWYHGREVPGCFFWVLPKTNIPKPDEHRKYIIRVVRHWYVI